MFDSWTDLIAQLAVLRAGNNGSGTYTILFDDSIVSPAPIPAGAYDMTHVTWSGRTFTLTMVSVAEGVVLTGLRHLENNLQVTFTGSTPPVSDFTGPFEAFAIDSGSGIVSVGTGPFIRNTGPSLVVIGLRDGGRVAFGGAPVIDVAVASPNPSLLIAGFAATTLESNTISGIAGATVQLGWLASSASLSEDQPALTGAGGILLVDNGTRDRRFSTPVFTADAVVDPNVVARVDTNGGPVTITLPPAFNNRGVSVVVKDVGGQAATNNIAVVSSGGDTVDGSFAQFITVDRGSLTFTSEGASEWMITAQSP